MNKKWIPLIVIAAVIFLLFFSIKGKYNTLVTLDEAVVAQWSQVENVYQRRADLIPNLVSTVKGYADFEKQTLTDVIEARSKATGINIDANNMNPEQLQQFQAAQKGLSSALSRLMVVVERYPNLKANQNFLELQAQLEGTENRISVERMKFIEITRNYNTSIRKFPSNIYASMFGFERKPNFQADEGAEKAPDVKDLLNN
ncbi:MAG: LemA family protein [Bacteroidota bacterium]|nr:LemA family protein [Bacteroidota bacterium]